MLLYEIDYLLEDRLPLILFRSVSLSIRDCCFEFLELSFDSYGEIRRQDIEYFSFCLFIGIIAYRSGNRFIAELHEDIFKQCFLISRKLDITGIVVILKRYDIGFGICFIDQSIPELSHKRLEDIHITRSSYALHAIDEIIYLSVDKRRLRIKAGFEIQERDGEIFRIRRSTLFGIIYSSDDRFEFGLIDSKMQFIAEEILIIILDAIVIAIESYIGIHKASASGIIISDIHQDAIIKILADKEIDGTAAYRDLRNGKDMEISCIGLAGSQRQRPFLIGFIGIGIGDLHRDEILAEKRIDEFESLT